MALNISILGLGKIGLSIGLALGRHVGDFHRTGYDPNPVPGSLPFIKEGLNKTEKNISKCVKNADLIFLCLPHDLLKQTLQDIAPHIGSETILLSTSHAKTATLEWVNEFMPELKKFAGIEFLLPPNLEPSKKDNSGYGSSELFENNLAAIATPPNTEPAVINQVANIIRLLGAVPFFCDVLEMDGLISTTQVLPQLVSAAFLNATTESPGWRDAGKFAGQEFAATSSSIPGDLDSSGLSSETILLKEHILRGLDTTLESVVRIRKVIADSDWEELEELLEKARINRQTWLLDRSNPETIGVAPPPVKLPSKGDYWRRQTGFLNLFPKKNQRLDKKDH